jgi:hypothetical protein
MLRLQQYRCGVNDDAAEFGGGTTPEIGRIGSEKGSDLHAGVPRMGYRQSGHCKGTI